MTRSALQQLEHVVSRCSRRRISSFGQTMASALVAALPFWGDMKTAELNARFVYSQQFMQNDPWAERAQGKDAEEFTSFRLSQFGKVA